MTVSLKKKPTISLMFEVFLKAKSVDKFDIYSHICEPRRGRALQNILNSHVSITLNYTNSFLSHF